MEMDDGYDGDAEDNEAPALSGNEREKAAPKGQGGVDDEWPINIFGCMENKLTCFLGCVLPCALNYLTAEKIGVSGAAYAAATLLLPPCATAFLRAKVRRYLWLSDGATGTDAAFSCFCGPCVVCQMANAVKVCK